jgi:hypothetical protein
MSVFHGCTKHLSNDLNHLALDLLSPLPASLASLVLSYNPLGDLSARFVATNALCSWPSGHITSVTLLLFGRWEARLGEVEAHPGIVEAHPGELRLTLESGS